MAKTPGRLKVEYSRRFDRQLGQIWQWNAERYNEEHANSYVDFLWDAAESLATDYLEGRIVSNCASYRFIVAQKRPRRYGHIIIYEVRPAAVFVVAIFHTSQDWENQLPTRET